MEIEKLTVDIQFVANVLQQKKSKIELYQSKIYGMRGENRNSTLHKTNEP